MATFPGEVRHFFCLSLGSPQIPGFLLFAAVTSTHLDGAASPGNSTDILQEAFIVVAQLAWPSLAVGQVPAAIDKIAKLRPADPKKANRFDFFICLERFNCARRTYFAGSEATKQLAT